MCFPSPLLPLLPLLVKNIPGGASLPAVVESVPCTDNGQSASRRWTEIENPRLPRFVLTFPDPSSILPGRLRAPKSSQE